MLEKSLEDKDSEELKWKFATLSNCSLALKKEFQSVEYYTKFMEQEPDKWELETFEKSKNEISSYLLTRN